MVRVVGPLRVVTDRPLLVSRVRVRAARDRAERGGLTAAFDDSVPVTDGQLDMQVLPGPAVMMLEVTGGFSHAVKLVVPDVETATLEQCVVAAEVADDADKRTLERLAGEVARDALAASEAAGRADDSAAAAGAAEARAGEHAQDAAESAKSAAASEAGAAGSAEDAAESAKSAATSEQNALHQAETAAQYTVAASRHADSARDDAERAATIAGSTRWVGTQLEVNGQLSPELMPTITISAADTWVVEGVDTGQPARGPGGASSWEDISGKPEAFPPAEHKHTSSQVTDAVNDTGDPRFGGKLIKGRDSDGKIFYYQEPTEGRELANKQYVDSVVSGAASVTALSTLEAQVNLRPAFFSGRGRPPANIPGAHVGDYWLDETSMELHKIVSI